MYTCIVFDLTMPSLFIISDCFRILINLLSFISSYPCSCVSQIPERAGVHRSEVTLLHRCMDVVVFWTYVYIYIPRTLMYVYFYILRTLIYDICCVLNIEIYVVPTLPLDVTGFQTGFAHPEGHPKECVAGLSWPGSMQ